MNKVVVVVEGNHDKAKLKEIYKDLTIFTTNGSAVDEQNIKELKMLSKSHEIILFLDPDHAGNRIRRILTKELVNVKHAYLKQEDAISTNQKKIGIEHATNAKIIEALKLVKPIKNETDITKDFLFEHGYIGQHNSKTKRSNLLNAFNIGYTNSKGLLDKLNTFGITKSEVMAYERS